MVIRAKAPLRLGLAGGGTDIAAYYDVYGGNVLNATIDMYAYCVLEPADGEKIVFRAPDLDVTEEYDPRERLTTANVLSLHSGVYNRIVADYNEGRPLSFTMTTYSDAPAGSGLGSSSTMVVAVIKAFAEWLNLPLGEYDIASLAYKVEREDLKLAGGKQDQYAATFGGFNFMEFYRDDRVIVNPLRLKRWIRNELEASLVLYYTGISRESGNIIKAQIDNTNRKNKVSIDNMHELKKQAVSMKEALLKGDMKNFSDCLLHGWLAKRKIADAITNPFLDELYSYALESGAASAKISGAGGGGFMMLYCDPCRRVALVRALKKREGVVLTPSFTEIGTQAWTLFDQRR
ncbi:MAG: dehydrogenase [Spirochaetaceae bacterium]|jgi:D-glycero-alpha-D-manno-heptose-7-phosphate kinase|nr:dehydrogenase [Spirochaetaceae bacterium]